MDDPIIWLAIGYISGILTIGVGALLRAEPLPERREHDPYVHPANIDRERVNREFAAFNR